ncbi:hypothetical protein AB0J72_08990 [Dactylosporangium sp. NPDC049742]|uniref:hypothetical protein n=1 Tax=Dactylosporangium sp. NPDC049742 TaxID=3154737 RepID=UPI0034371B0C
MFALSVAAGGYLLGIGPAPAVARVLTGLAALALLWLSLWTVLTGAALLLAAVLVTLIRRNAHETPDPARPTDLDRAGRLRGPAGREHEGDRHGGGDHV